MLARIRVYRKERKMNNNSKNQPLMASNDNSLLTKKGHSTSLPSELYSQVLSCIIDINGQPVILDSDVARLYGVETRVVNQAVSRNIERFPDDFRFQISLNEARNLKSQNVTSKWGGARKPSYVFTEKGLYMLATVLKSKQALDVTFSIIETFAKVRELKQELVSLHKEKDKKLQADKMHRFSELLSDIVMPDLETTETESTLELNFFIGKIKHTVKRVKKNNGMDKEKDK